MDSQVPDDVQVTLALPSDTKFPLITGQWEKKGGEFIATYSMGQLREFYAMMQASAELEEESKEAESGIRLF